MSLQNGICCCTTGSETLGYTVRWGNAARRSCGVGKLVVRRSYRRRCFKSMRRRHQRTLLAAWPGRPRQNGSLSAGVRGDRSFALGEPAASRHRADSSVRSPSALQLPQRHREASCLWRVARRWSRRASVCSASAMSATSGCVAGSRRREPGRERQCRSAGCAGAAARPARRRQPALDAGAEPDGRCATRQSSRSPSPSRPANSKADRIGQCRQRSIRRSASCISPRRSASR